jgi:large subunit ribosomal protein L10
MVEALGQIFSESGAIVVARYAGLTVAEMTDFRRRMGAAGARFKVAKNRLAKIALENTERTSAADMFNGPVGIAYSDDPVAPAKVATEYAKENDKLVVIGGIIGTTAIDQKGIEALAKMPSLDELRAKLAGVLSAPGTKLVRTLNEPGGRLVRTLAAPGGNLRNVLLARKQQQEAA